MSWGARDGATWNIPEVHGSLWIPPGSLASRISRTWILFWADTLRSWRMPRIQKQTFWNRHWLSNWHWAGIRRDAGDSRLRNSDGSGSTGVETSSPWGIGIYPESPLPLDTWGRFRVTTSDMGFRHYIPAISTTLKHLVCFRHVTPGETVCRLLAGACAPREGSCKRTFLPWQMR